MVATVVMTAVIILTIVCCLRRRAKVVEEIVTHEDESVDKSAEKENVMFNVNESQDVPNDSDIKIKQQRVHKNNLHIHQLNENSEVIEN